MAYVRRLMQQNKNRQRLWLHQNEFTRSSRKQE
jgi:hypothetical protein